MIINLQTGKSSPKARVDYLLYGADGDRDHTKVDILDGNPELFVEIAEKNPYKTKTYNYLISFGESKEELLKKLKAQGKSLEELYREVFSFLLPAEYYPPEALNVLAIGHADTDNYHIHLTIENYDHQNSKSLYIPKTKTELDFYRALEEYISTKYGLEFRVRPRGKGRVGVEKIKEILEKRGEYRSKTRDEIKEEITQYLTELVLSGEVNSREELIEALLEIPNLEISRIGKSYITLVYNGVRYRLKGGIYDEERFERIKGELIGVERGKAELEQVFREALRKREELFRKRRPSRSNGGRLELPGRSFNPEELERDRERDEERICELKEASDRNYSLLDRSFPFDWSIAMEELFKQDAERLFLSLPAEDSFRPERPEVEGVRLTTGNLMPGYQRKLDTLSANSYSYTEMKLREIKEMERELLEVRKEELQLLRELDPEEVLSALGIKGYERKSGYYLMNSPLREDKNPSFQVFYGTERQCWIYMDFGTGWRGSSIDLWMAVKGLDYGEAVRDMRETFGINLLEENSKDIGALKERIKRKREEFERIQREKRKEFTRSEREEVKKASHKLLRVKEPSNKKLLEFLEKRGVKEIPDWLKEVHYLHIGRKGKKFYYGLGVVDENGVWHIRNAFEEGLKKLNLITAPDQEPTYTLIKRDEKSRKVVIVEGLFDALTINQLARNKDFDILILNSVSNVDRVIENGVLLPYNIVYLALDNDEAGRKAEEELLKHLKQLKRRDLVFNVPEEKEMKIYRLIFNSKDINEAYMKNEKIEKKDITSLILPELEEKRKKEREERESRYIGKIENNVVLSDNKAVLKRLGIKNIGKIRSAKEFADYWRKNKCRGEIKIYGQIPDWIDEAVEMSEWRGIVKAPYLVSGKEERSFKPTGIKREIYFDTEDKGIVLEEDIKSNPKLYIHSDIPELKRLAEKELERKRKEQLEMMIRTEREKNKDRGIRR